MKKCFFFIIILVMSNCSLFAMQQPEESAAENQATAMKRFYEAAFNNELPYAQKRIIFLETVPLLNFVPQNHYVNPLIDTLLARDYEITELLLKKGASPVFRGISCINGYDALRLQLGYLVENPASRSKLTELLNSYKKEGEEITPYCLAGHNSMYITDRELEEERQENMQREQ